MNNIGIDQSSFTMSSFEHRCMNNIKKIYQHAGKCDDQHYLKDIIDAALLYTPEGFTDDCTNVPMKSTPVNKPSARKSLCLFTNKLAVKPKTAKCRVVDTKSKRKSMKVGNILCTNKSKRKGHSKINEQIKNNWYAWITRHPQIVQSTIYNDCIKVLLDNKTEPQLVPKLLLQVSVRELYNSPVIDPNDGGLKDARDEDGNIIISDSTLRSLLPPQLKKCPHDTR